MRITDLHQGIVWGTHTAETKLDERLINRFYYDGDYGTAPLSPAGRGDLPLSLHGARGQTRAPIQVQDAVRCIRIAIAEERV